MSTVTFGNVDFLARRRWKLVAEGTQGGVGGAWRQDAEKWLNWSCAVRSRGVLAESVALLPLGVAQRRHSQRQGGQKAPSTRRCIKTRLSSTRRSDTSRQKAPSTTRCIKTGCEHADLIDHPVRKLPAPQGALRLDGLQVDAADITGSESTQHQKVH